MYKRYCLISVGKDTSFNGHDIQVNRASPTRCALSCVSKGERLAEVCVTVCVTLNGILKSWSLIDETRLARGVVGGSGNRKEPFATHPSPRSPLWPATYARQ